MTVASSGTVLMNGVEVAKELAISKLRGVALASGVYYLVVVAIFVASFQEAETPTIVCLSISLVGFLAGLAAFVRGCVASATKFSLAAVALVGTYVGAAVLQSRMQLPGVSNATYMLALISVAVFEFRWSRALFLWGLVWIGWWCCDKGEGASVLMGAAAQVWAAALLMLRRRQGTGSLTHRSELDAERRKLEDVCQHLKAAYKEKESLHQQLFQSQKMEALGRLAGGVAHDFNNLLTVILGNLDLLRQTSAISLDADELVRDAESAAQRASEVVGHLLAFSRKEVVETRDFKLQRLVEKSLAIISRLIGEDVDLVVALQDPDGVISGDPSRLEQVLFNLVVNARDAMPDGGTLKIGLERQEQEIVLTVEDSGCGMPVDIKERIFEPFFTTKRVGEGTGLGLSTVLGIVGAHSGRLQVNSEVGSGSRFAVFLPRLRAGQAQESIPKMKLRRGEAKASVLLVEDDPQVRRLTARVLELLGYKVTSVENGEKALSWLQQMAPCQLIITDAVMPGMGGHELAEKARLLRPDVPLLFISGYDGGRLKRLALSGQFLSKPFSPAQLQQSVERCLAPR